MYIGYVQRLLKSGAFMIIIKYTFLMIFFSIRRSLSWFYFSFVV